MPRFTLVLRSLGSSALLAAIFLPLATCKGCDGKVQELRATDHWELMLAFALPALLVVARLIWPKRNTLITCFDVAATVFALGMLGLATMFRDTAIGFDVAMGGGGFIIGAVVVDVVLAIVDRRQRRRTDPPPLPGEG